MLDLGRGATEGWIRYTASLRFLDFSPEAVRLDDGSVWTRSTTAIYSPSPRGPRMISRLNMATGAFTTLFYKEEAWNYSPADAFVPVGRKSAAIYLPFWESSVTPFSDHLVNATLGCVRADAGTVNAQSLVFGPASAASGNANRIVYGATYSPANDAMYLATAKVANADLGTIFEIDKGVADASLCRCGARRDGARHRSRRRAIDEAALHPRRDAPLRNGERQAHAARRGGPGRGAGGGPQGRRGGVSQVKGYLAESADGTVVAVVFDYDVSGKNTARRLVSVEVATGAWTSRDVTSLIEEWEPYPGVMRRN